jgi:hypothetical protein
VKIGRHAELAHRILRAMHDLERLGVKECTGFQICCEVEWRKECTGFQICCEVEWRSVSKHRCLTGYGTLYWVLSALEKRGALTSRWEAVSGDVPRRKYYSLRVRS